MIGPYNIREFEKLRTWEWVLFFSKHDVRQRKCLKYYTYHYGRNGANASQSWEAGEALFQDIYVERAIVDIDPVFEELPHAFDSLQTDEERIPCKWR